MNAPYVWQSHLGNDVAFDAGYHEVSRSDILSFINDPPGTVLDIGCAGGVMGRLVKQKFPGTRVIGIEPNPSAAAQARQHLDLVVSKGIEEMDAARDLGGGEIGVVLLMDVLEHLVDPWRTLLGLRQLISAETRVLASIPNVRNLATLHELAGGRWQYRPAGVLDVTHLRFFTLTEMGELFAQTGYRVLSADPLTHPERMADIVTAHEPGRIETSNISVRYRSIEELEEYFAIQYVIDARKCG
ncbi:MAG: class I SAM-dependent methyltransferase [Casimicrobiaceae bacterium]